MHASPRLRAAVMAMLVSTSANALNDLDCAAVYVAHARAVPTVLDATQPRIAHAMQRFHSDPPPATSGQPTPITVEEIRSAVGSRFIARMHRLEQARETGQPTFLDEMATLLGDTRHCDTRYGFVALDHAPD